MAEQPPEEHSSPRRRIRGKVRHSVLFSSQNGRVMTTHLPNFCSTYFSCNFLNKCGAIKTLEKYWINCLTLNIPSLCHVLWHGHDIVWNCPLLSHTYWINDCISRGTDENIILKLKRSPSIDQKWGVRHNRASGRMTSPAGSAQVSTGKTRAFWAYRPRCKWVVLLLSWPLVLYQRAQVVHWNWTITSNGNVFVVLL